MKETTEKDKEDRLERSVKEEEQVGRGKERGGTGGYKKKEVQEERQEECVGKNSKTWSEAYIDRTMKVILQTFNKTVTCF